MKMSYVTDRKGKSTEAFDLIMRKEFAYQILKGEKTVEYRDFSKFYLNRFYKDTKSWELRTDSNCVHFHDYNNTWFLDVLVTEIEFFTFSDHDFFWHMYRGDTTFEKEIEEHHAKKRGFYDPDTTGCFCLPIAAIINTNLDISGLDVEFMD